MKTNNPSEEIAKLLKKIHDVIAGGEYIYRGESVRYHKVSSNLYREFKKAIKAESFKIKAVQDEILRNVEEHTKEREEDTILEYLQHYGGKTNQIDFTTDYLIALFFACDGRHKQHGRLVFLNKTKIKNLIHKPRYPENRVIAQKSIFVRPPTGIVKPDKTITIEKELKKSILRYLAQRHDINTGTIYNDIQGYITRHKSHESAYTNFYLGSIYQEEQKYELAIKYYTKALEHNETFVEAYNNRGVIYYNQGDLKKAFADFDQAVKFNQKYVDIYLNQPFPTAIKEAMIPSPPTSKKK